MSKSATGKATKTYAERLDRALVLVERTLRGLVAELRDPAVTRTAQRATAALVAGHLKAVFTILAERHHVAVYWALRQKEAMDAFTGALGSNGAPHVDAVREMANAWKEFRAEFHKDAAEEERAREQRLLRDTLVEYQEAATDAFLARRPGEPGSVHALVRHSDLTRAADEILSVLARVTYEPEVTATQAVREAFARASLTQPSADAGRDDYLRPTERFADAVRDDLLRRLAGEAGEIPTT